jgi:hypothetical protein
MTDEMTPEDRERLPYFADVGMSILDDLGDHNVTYYMTDTERVVRIDEHELALAQTDLDFMMRVLIMEKLVTVCWSRGLTTHEEFQDKIGQRAYPIVITDKGLEVHREFRARWNGSR